MTTTTSFSKGSRFASMYRFSLRQNAGYFGLSSLLIFLVYPLQYLMEAFKKLDSEPLRRVMGSSALAADLPPSPYDFYNLFGLGRNFTHVSIVLFTAVFLLLPFVLALMLNSYMHSKKAADVYHALPVKRETLLGVNAAVAMTIVTVPLVISNLVVAAASLAKFGKDAPIGFLFLDMVCWLVCAFMIYVVATFVSVQSGTVFDTFLFSGVLFFALPLLLLVAVLVGETFLYGFDMNSELLHYALRLSPVLLPMERMTFFYDTYLFRGDMVSRELADFNAHFPGSNMAIAVYFVLAALLLCLSMRLYVRRHSERAETATSRGALATAVVAVGTVIAGIFTGLLFYSMDGEPSKGVCVLWTIIGCLVIFTVLEVILNRGFKLLRRRAPVGGIITAVSLVIVGIAMTGGLGYETRVPNPESVRGVQISWDSSYYGMGASVIENAHGRSDYTLTSEEAIRAVVEFQEAITQERFDRNTGELIEQGKIPAYADVRIKYDKTIPLSRNYWEMSADTLETLIPLEVSKEFQEQNNPFFLIAPEEIKHWTVSDALGWNVQKVALSQEDSARLLEAVRADYLARTAEDALHPTAPVRANLAAWVPEPKSTYVTARSRSYISYDFDQNWNPGFFEVKTPVAGEQTLAVLEELNLLPDAPDLSQCIAAVVENGNDYSIEVSESVPVTGHLNVDGSLIEMAGYANDDGRKAYEQYQEDYNREMSDPESAAYRKARGITIFLEDPGEIAALAKAIVPSWRADEPLVTVRFFTENEGTHRTALVPLSKLPVELQEKLSAK